MHHFLIFRITTATTAITATPAPIITKAQGKLPLFSFSERLSALETVELEFIAVKLLATLELATVELLEFASVEVEALELFELVLLATVELELVTLELLELAGFELLATAELELLTLELAGFELELLELATAELDELLAALELAERFDDALFNNFTALSTSVCDALRVDITDKACCTFLPAERARHKAMQSSSLFATV